MLWRLAYGMTSQVAAMSDDSDTGYTETKYPIVLVHSLFGFDQILSVDYWYKIFEMLAECGAQVFVTQVASANDPEVL